MESSLTPAETVVFHLSLELEKAWWSKDGTKVLRKCVLENGLG